MRWFAALLLLTPAVVCGEDRPAPISAEQAREGWLLLFDRESTFGWSVTGRAEVRDGQMILGGGDGATIITSKAVFTALTADWSFDHRGAEAASLTWRGVTRSLPKTDGPFVADLLELASGPPSPITLTVPAGTTLTLRRFAVRPSEMKPLFNGKDLSGWRRFTGDPKRERSQFAVTAEGWLQVKDGPGDLQTEGQYADFLLQLECISHGPGLNSGIFFRALPGQYQQGYEAQIQNSFKDGDRTKPADFGTGAIYRRQPARRVVPNDGEWFTMTVMAHGPQILTWVNGYPTCDFNDDRPAQENARNGRKTDAGIISIQGHDPTTDLSFRNIRIVELR